MLKRNVLLLLLRLHIFLTIFITEIIDQDERVLKDQATVIVVSELADSSVNFTVRAWTSADDYWSFFFETTEKVKKQFDAHGVSIPFPQRDVHVYEHQAG